jgi:hypothetical protein
MRNCPLGWLLAAEQKLANLVPQHAPPLPGTAGTQRRCDGN